MIENNDIHGLLYDERTFVQKATVVHEHEIIECKSKNEDPDGPDIITEIPGRSMSTITVTLSVDTPIAKRFAERMKEKL